MAGNVPRWVIRRGAWIGIRVRSRDGAARTSASASAVASRSPSDFAARPRRLWRSRWARTARTTFLGADGCMNSRTAARICEGLAVTYEPSSGCVPERPG